MAKSAEARGPVKCSPSGPSRGASRVSGALDSGRVTELAASARARAASVGALYVPMVVVVLVAGRAAAARSVGRQPGGAGGRRQRRGRRRVKRALEDVKKILTTAKEGAPESRCWACRSGGSHRGPRSPSIISGSSPPGLSSATVKGGCADELVSALDGGAGTPSRAQARSAQPAPCKRGLGAV
jgi:hypothetical protein